MRGRKPSVPHQVIIDAVVLFKDRVIVTDRDGVKRKYLPILITYWHTVISIIIWINFYIKY